MAYCSVHVKLCIKHCNAVINVLVLVKPSIYLDNLKIVHLLHHLSDEKINFSLYFQGYYTCPVSFQGKYGSGKHESGE